MAQTRSRNQQGGLHFVALHAFNQARNHFFSQRGRIGNEAAKTPKDLVELADDAITLKLKQTSEWQLRIAVAADSSGIVTARREAQVFRFYLRGNLAKAEIPGH